MRSPEPRAIASVAGREYPPVNLTIDGDHAAAFARALGTDPVEGVPPTYAAVYALGATARQLFADEEASIDFSNLLHAEQEFEWERQAEPGEEVTARARVSSDTERRGTRLIRLETDVAAADGSPLCRSKALFVVRWAAV